ncbi:MAG: histidine kinase [Cyclobacteriaceae bacterium]
MKKYPYRLIIGFLVFFFFKITQVENWRETFIWDLESAIYLAYTMMAIMVVWEVVSRSISYWKSRCSILVGSGLYRISLKAALLALPLVFLFSYIFIFYVDGICCDGIGHLIVDNVSRFWVMSAQGFVIALLIISYEIIIHYVRNAIQNARETEIMKKELIAARFEGLKNQVNPHFLFNSFSVLTSLVEKDSKKAVEFIAKLSDMYRYILETDERMMVDLEEELAFLDDYVFLLEMRHSEGLIIEKELKLDDRVVKIPPMSLQILVENAVKHNAFSPEDPLKITIRNEEGRFIVVENHKRPKNDLVHSTGIGLKNLSKRLMLSLKKGLEIVEDSYMFKVKLPIGSEQ